MGRDSYGCMVGGCPAGDQPPRRLALIKHNDKQGHKVGPVAVLSESRSLASQDLCCYI